MARVTRYHFRAPLATKQAAIPADKFGWQRSNILYLCHDALCAHADEEHELAPTPVKKGGAWH